MRAVFTRSNNGFGDWSSINKPKNRTSEKNHCAVKYVIVSRIWRGLGIEPSKPGTQVSDGFEDRGGHQNPIQPRKDNISIQQRIL